MHTVVPTAGILGFALLAISAGSALAAGTPVDDLMRLTWRDYEIIYVQDGRPIQESAGFIHTAKAKKMDELDQVCKAKVRSVLEQEAPQQVGDDKTVNERKQRIARGYLTCMLIEMKPLPNLKDIGIVVSHRRSRVELDPFRPGETTSLTL